MLAAGAGVLPDTDEPHSTIARSFGFLTRSAARVTEHLSGGHRHGTHSLLGTGLFTAGAFAAAHYAGTLTGQVALGVFLSLLLASALRAIRSGGHFADAIAVAGAVAAVHWRYGLTLIPLAVVTGTVAHIAGDCLTHGGCPLFWPLSMREFHLLPRPLRFTTGKIAEHWVVSPLLLAGLAYLAWRDAATSAIHHAPVITQSHARIT